MKQWNELYKADVEEYLKEQLIGKSVDTFWSTDVAKLIEKLVPEEYRLKITAYQYDGTSLYTDVQYDKQTLFIVGIKRSRQLKDRPWPYQAQATFTYKDVAVYISNDKLSLKDCINFAIFKRSQEEDKKNEKLRSARKVYNYIKEVLKTSSYSEIAGFISFMSTNLPTIERPE